VSSSIAQKSSEIWTVQADLQPIPFKSDRLIGLQDNKKAVDRTAGVPGRSSNPQFR
jgi:hypothetical protein